MKKWIAAIAVTAGICIVLLYASVYFFVIPSAAKTSLPFKLRNVAAGLKKGQYEIYLGKPQSNQSQSTNKDVWIKRNGNYIFSLMIEYNEDSISNAVQLNYSFSNSFFYKTGIIYNNKEE
jgi:hypothetical protein